MNKQFELVKSAARQMHLVTDELSARVLNQLADELVANRALIIEANRRDLSRKDPKDPMYDRLMLTEERIEGIAADTRNVAKLPVPYGEQIETRTLPNGLLLRKVRVPLGVVGVIYEARPNVTVDVFALCLRSGNAVVLKGGSDADDSNRALVEIIHKVLKANNIDPNIVQLLPPARENATELMNAVGYVDVLIPRGSKRLIEAVRDNAKVPVIETGAGVVHTYYDSAADLAKGLRIVVNGKTRRVSVCNALDCLVIHRERLQDLVEIGKELSAKGVEILADDEAYGVLEGRYGAALSHATEECYGYEFQALRLAVKTVGSIDEALEHIYRNSSKHSEAIVTEDAAAAQRFETEVDAACVYVNAPTSFTDGAQFGLGAEIGISTQKLHARGPMGLKELTTYKWLIKGDGQIRP